MTHKLLELLRYEGPELSRAFEKASISGRGTPQEIADRRETALREFVSRYFPFPYRVAKGNIVDSFGAESDSIDCVLLNPAHPHTIDGDQKFTVILADAVDAAIELKPDLQSTSELQRGLRQLMSVKRLVRAKSGAIFPEKYPAHIIEDSKRIATFIFADKAKCDPKTTAAEILEFYKVNDVPLIEQLDFVIVNGAGIIANYKYPEKTLRQPDETGMFWEEWGDSTIAAFLLKLTWIDGSVPEIDDPIIERYLKDLQPSASHRIP